ncbi:MAG: ATP-binding protein [Geminicoccaceae bacterium]
MKIQSKIIVFQLFFISLIVVMSAVVFLAIGRADRYIERVSLAYRQLETITSLSLHANRYSEQIAEMLLFGESGRAELEEARRDLASSFVALQDATMEELELVDVPADRETERQELILLDEMRAVAAEMHATALELLGLTLSGREGEARLRYYGEIEEDLDDRLQRLIDLAIADEEAEVRQVERQTAALTEEMIVVVAVTTLLAVIASLGAVMLLTRALARPIGRLIDGSSAIGGGQLSHRIAVQGRDELATLSGHFNHMAEQLEVQRRALLAHQDELERNVRDRTAQLESANRRLKDLDRLRVLFLADVSHELRTPLTILRGEAEVTLRSRVARLDDYRETLRGVVDQAEQMGRLVDDLLFLTRAEADSLRFESTSVVLQDVLKEAVAEGRVLARSNGRQVAASLPSAPLIVTTDRQRLKQTTLIAIDNAIKYSHPGSSVEVELQAEGRCAVIVVRNRGDAIPPEDLPYVFDRFYRGRQTGPIGGSGLGLSIAKWIVEKLGGEITVDSLPDGVTELRIHLRLREIPLPATLTT